MNHRISKKKKIRHGHTLTRFLMHNVCVCVCVDAHRATSSTVARQAWCVCTAIAVAIIKSTLPPPLNTTSSTLCVCVCICSIYIYTLQTTRPDAPPRQSAFNIERSDRKSTLCMLYSFSFFREREREEEGGFQRTHWFFIPCQQTTTLGRKSL